MGSWFQIAANGSVSIFGIRLVGVNSQNLRKLLVTVAFLVALWILRKILRAVTAAIFGTKPGHLKFWTRQAIRLISAVVLLVGLISIWFNAPSQLGSAAALVTAGLAVASQRIITAFAGYLTILRGKNFNVGDRIMMGGVRGDVIAVGFMQTTIMEMGQPVGEQNDPPSMWVEARQYTGRIVTLTNDKIFDEPVYNYSRDFPYIWEEMRLPIPYNADWHVAEKIILDSVARHTVRVQELGETALKNLQDRYMVERAELEPRVYMRLTDNWTELAVRFLTGTHGIRGVKDKIARDILDGLNQAKIGIASGTYEVVGMPELKVKISEAK